MYVKCIHLYETHTFDMKNALNLIAIYIFIPVLVACLEL